MEHKVIYPTKDKKFAVETIREHLCGFFQMQTICIEEGLGIDTTTGHTLCCGCDRITVDSGLRVCSICNTEYIDKNRFQDPAYETNCKGCEVSNGF